MSEMFIENKQWTDIGYRPAEYKNHKPVVKGSCFFKLYFFFPAPLNIESFDQKESCDFNVWF